MYCPNCGEQIDDKAVICPKCGVPTKIMVQDDAPSKGFAVLGFFIPLLGFILYLVWKSETPLKAKSAGKGALIGFIVRVVLRVLYWVVFGILLGSEGYYSVPLLF